MHGVAHPRLATSAIGRPQRYHRFCQLPDRQGEKSNASLACLRRHCFTALLFGLANLVVVSSGHAQFSASSQTNIISGLTTNWPGDYVVGSNTFANALIVTNAGVLKDSAGYVGYAENSSNNLALITGTGSIWTNAGQLTIGFIGAGNTLQITNGASVYDAGCSIGAYQSADGNAVTISGNGSYWKSMGIYVGWFGNGNSLRIADGALVSSTYGEISHTTGASDNTVMVTGAGATWHDTGDFVIGGRFDSSFDNSMTISNGGAVVVGGKLSISPVGVSSNNTLNVSEGGLLSVTNGAITMGNGVSHGRFVISGGTVLAKDLVATNGNCILTFNAGTLQTRSLWLNNGAPFIIGNAGHATWLPQAGTNVLMGGLLLGADCTATGVLAITSGRCNVTNVAQDATLEVRSGTLTLSGGLLQVDRFVMTNACARFVRSGGTLLVSTTPILDPVGDADGDGLPNAWEQTYNLDALDATGQNGASGDPDGDGTTNANEYRGGTNPSDPSSNVWLSIWDSATDGSWHHPSNWFTGVPSLSRPNVVITNAASKTVTIDATTVLTNALNGCLTISNLTMRGVAGATNTLALSDAGTTTPLRILNAATLNAGSALVCTNSALRVDGLAAGKFRVDGGFDFRNGELTTTNADIEIGYLGTGSVAVADSSWRAKTVKLGMGYANSRGFLLLTGGTNIISGGSSVAGNPAFSIGETSGSTGTVYLVGGELITTNGRSFIGSEGVGTMTISNGTWRAARSDIAYWIYSSGTLNVAGGKVIIYDPVWSYRGVKSTVHVSGGELYTTNLVPIAGGYGAAEIILSGGKWNSTGLEMSFYENTVSTLTVTGGTHNLGSVQLAMGYNSRSTMTYTGGELTTSFLRVGDGGIAECTVSNRPLHAGWISVGGNGGFGTLTLVDANVDTRKLTVGCNTGIVWVTRGELVVANGDSEINGRMTVDNAIWRPTSVMVGASANYPSSGVLTLNGGKSIVSSNLFLGYYGPGGQAVMNLNGGEFIITNGSTSIGYTDPGLMNLNGGNYRARELRVGDLKPGTLNINTGSHEITSKFTVGSVSCLVTGAVFHTGGLLAVTNTTHDATFEIRTGTFTLGAAATLIVDRFVMTDSACARLLRTGGVLVAGTVVLNPQDDADGDGLPNAWEQAHGLDPLDATGRNGPAADNDADSFSNQQEYLADTNPTDSASVLRFIFAGVATNQLVLTWQGGIQATQRLWRASSLASDDWQQISNFTPPTPATNTWVTSVTNAASYYRLDATR